MEQPSKSLDPDTLTRESDMAASEIAKRIEVAEHVRFWGQDYTITPCFVSSLFGDGKKLLGVAPLNTRPNYYVIRVDSSWKTSNYEYTEPTVGDYSDEICEAIEDEYGSKFHLQESGDDEQLEDDLGWPVLDDENGISWFEIKGIK